MKIFELHFNHKKKQDSVFDTFIFEPSLCMAGELTNAMPQNNDFLNKLADVIKNGFYSKADFSESLKEANDFLDRETKLGNVNWLGNLNFAVISIGNSILNFAKVGNAKILLLREGEVLDIGQNLELQDQEPYPMKVFSNTASGKLLAQDKIAVLTNEVFSAISQNESIFNQLSLISKEKELKNIFKLNKNIFSEAAGICLLISTTPGIKLIPKRMPKGIILIAGLILILTLAFFLFRSGESGKKEGKKEQFNQNQAKLEEARSKIMMAENFIIIKREEKARALFQEAWDILQSVKTKEASSLQESIKEYIILTPR